jgi:hypothetical protein
MVVLAAATLTVVLVASAGSGPAPQSAGPANDGSQHAGARP